MPSLRFPTVSDLYEAFPEARDDVGADPGNEPPLTFLQSLLEQESWDKAVSFCAYLLPRREAVWWGCQSLRRVKAQFPPAELAALDAAEAWVREPEENFRRAALAVGNQNDGALPAVWMALAAGWSGGSILPPEYSAVQAPPHQTARAVRTGILIAMSQLPAAEIPRLIRPCIESGIELARG